MVLNKMVIFKIVYIVSMTSFWEGLQFCISLLEYLPKVVLKSDFYYLKTMYQQYINHETCVQNLSITRE